MKKRILSCVLSAALLLGLTPWSALATDDPLDDQTSQTELQTNFQSPPQDPDIYADPQPNIPVPEAPEVQTVPVPAALAAGSVTVTTEDDLRTAVANGGEVTLGSSITLTNSRLYIPKGKEVTLDLHGHTLEANVDDDAILIEIGATLILNDSGTGGTITHTSGKIGSGVFVGGEFTMTGGTISGNTANQYGGGVCLWGYAKFTMTGGSITGNNANSAGGGVYMQTKEGTFTVSGTPNITGNTGSNVYLNTGNRATFTIGEDGLKSGAKIGVSIPIASTPLNSSASVTIATGADNILGGSIFADDSNNCKVKGSGTDLVLVHATSKHTDHDDKTFDHKLTSRDGKLYIDDTLQKNYEIKPGPYDTKAYYLAGDLTLDKTLYISGSGGNNVCICLNGHSITQTGNYDVINVANNVSLSLYDCSGVNAGQITHASGATGRGVKFFAETRNTFDMYGGTITGNNATDADDNMGGGVLVTGSGNGSFNLHGGVITGNSAANGGGVAVCSTQSNNKNTSRYFNMSGGTISDNQASDNGGGVYVENNGRVTVSGGEIKDNTATKGGGIGGGISGTNNGGSIDASTCPPIYITVSDRAKITGNSAPVGGGIYAGDDAHGYCRFTMTGGEISGNTSVYNKNYTYNGGGVYLGGTMTVSGDAKIVNNTKDNESNNVFLPQVGDSTDYFTMTIGDDGLKSGASIGVTSSKALADGEAVTIVSSGAASGSENYFTADAGTTYNIQRVGETLVLVNGTLTHKHPICGKKCTHTPKHEDVTWTAINSAEALQNAAGGNSESDTRYYYLTDNVTLDSTWTPSGYLALDLGNYALTTTQSVDTIQLNSGANLTLTSCGTHGGTVQHSGRDVYGRGVVVPLGATFTMYNVELTNHEAADLRVNGAGVYVNGGTFNMRSGSLVDNTSKSNSGGGGVLVDNGGTFNLYSGTISDGNAYLGAGVSVKDNSTFNMYGGTISGNKASDPNTIYGEGGGVYVEDSTFIMTGGEIKNNSASDRGGGVYVKNSTFKMTGGEITGNGNGNNRSGGGVYVASVGKSTFTVGGTVTITGNKHQGSTSNVYLNGDKTITLASNLSDTSRIGVNKAGADQGPVPFATGASSANTLDYYKSIFSSDVDTHTYKITNDDKWDLYIGAHQHTWNYTAKGNKLTATCSAADCTLYQNNGYFVTIEASNPTYDGNEKKATIVAARGWHGPAVNTIPITYEVKKDDGTFVKMAANSFPTAVGTYRASISLTGVDKKTATASVEYTILPKTIDTFTYSSDPLTYNGTEQTCPELNVELSEGGSKVALQAGTDYIISGDNKGTNAGTYTLQLTFCGNYKCDHPELGKIEWKIVPLTVELDWQNVTDRTYGDSKTVTATVSNKYGNDDVSVTVEDGGKTAVGTYTAKATGLTGAQADNYKLAGNPTREYTIGKKSIAIPAENTTKFTYNGAEQTYMTGSADYTVSGNVQKDAGTYTVTAALRDKVNTQWADGKTDDRTYSFTIGQKPVTVKADDQATRLGQPLAELTYTCDPAPYAGDPFTGKLTTDADKDKLGSRTITQGTLSLGNNYSITFESGTYTVTKKQIQSNFQFASGLINKTYGDDSFTMTATGAAEGSTVSYESSNTNVATVDNTGKVTIVGAGHTTIKATAAETKDYASASASYTLTVAQAKLTITAKDQSAYIGDKVPELGADSYTVTGLVKGESLTTALTTLPTVRYVDENGQKVEPDMTKAGETVIRASGAEASGNYVIVAFTDGKLTVSARPSSGGGGGGSSTPSYPVSTPSKGGNGSVSSNAKNAASGSTVTITVKPDSGYQLETLAVTDHRGNALKLTDQGNGTYTFTMPSGQVDVKATFTQAADEASPFDDVSKDDYYYDAVKWAADSGITGGVGGSLFGSDQSCTRAQIITFLWRAAGSPEPNGAADMTDVPQDAYYAKAVAWAMENGITSGTGADRFSPHAACTRAQGMTFLFRSSKASASGTPAFQDVAADAYYAQAVKWAADNGITSGIGGGLFDPDNGCTRAQIVTFLWKLYAGK